MLMLLGFGKERIYDVADHSEHFNERLEQTIQEMFSPDVPLTPTDDLRTCRSCPYLQMCRR